MALGSQQRLTFQAEHVAAHGHGGRLDTWPARSHHSQTLVRSVGGDRDVAGPSLRTLPMKGEVLVASLPGLLLEEHFAPCAN